jgi:hypothetical protein
MSTKRKLHVVLLPLCLAWMVASAAAAAGTRDVRLHGPNGDGGGECNAAADAEIAAPATAAEAADSKATKPARKAPATKIKPIVPVVRGGDDPGLHAPRWHSFLPGMFR